MVSAGVVVVSVLVVVVASVLVVVDVVVAVVVVDALVVGSVVVGGASATAAAAAAPLPKRTTVASVAVSFWRAMGRIIGACRTCFCTGDRDPASSPFDKAARGQGWGYPRIFLLRVRARARGRSRTSDEAPWRLCVGLVLRTRGVQVQETNSGGGSCQSSTSVSSR